MDGHKQVDMGFRPRPSDVVVAVMGMTGSGKSTFVSLCTNEDVEIGHDLHGCRCFELPSNLLQANRL